MIGPVWRSLEKHLSELAEKFEHTAMQIFAQKDMSALNELQQAVIDLGNVLEEEYHLRDTEMICFLEKCCEDIYSYFEHPGMDEEQRILCGLRRIPEVFKQSIPLKDVSLAITAIVKNEGKYIIEWLEYHRMVGVQHFYIYDNDSTDHLEELLRWYIDEGIVTYIPWSGIMMQLPAYNHSIKHHKNDVKWMAFIDADEYIVPVTKKTIPEEITYIFSNYFGYPPLGTAAGMAVNWRSYGTSFHETPAEGLIIENYTYRGEDLSEKNKCIKTICNPRCVEGYVRNPHEVKYKEGYYSISENGSYVYGPWFRDGICNRIRINHYYSKSTQEFRAKFAKGRADSRIVDAQEYIEKECKDAALEYNRVHDDIMEKYVDELRKRVEERKQR